MSVQTKIENYLNYITGSGGNWPSNTNIGVIGGVDYIVEHVVQIIYTFTEMNTACGVYGSYATQVSIFDIMADYANDKDCTSAYVYGQDDSRKRNPSSFTTTLNQFKFCQTQHIQ